MNKHHFSFLNKSLNWTLSVPVAPDRVDASATSEAGSEPGGALVDVHAAAGTAGVKLEAEVAPEWERRKNSRSG